MHICFGKITIIGSDNGLSHEWSQAHYLNQHQNIVNLTLRNKLQGNFNGNSHIFIKENMFENVVWRWRPFCLSLNVLTTNQWKPFLVWAHSVLRPGSSEITWPIPWLLMPWLLHRQVISSLAIEYLSYHVSVRKCNVMFNALWPIDPIWRQKTGSTLVQVMARCLTAPNHYLNQCWLIIGKVLWHSSKGNFTAL